MRITKKIISAALAVMMVASTTAVASFSASAATVKAPKSVSVVNKMKGVKITWSKVKGASKYNIYRGTKKIKTTKKASYTDSKALAGKTYKYKVAAVKGKKISKKVASKSITRLNNVDVSSVKNTASGAKITWTSRKGAKKYIVYKKEAGKYTKLATVTSTSYTDKKAVSGAKNTYKVCGVAANNSKSDCNVKSATFLAQVKSLTARQAVDMNGVALKWAAVKGATEYTIYRQKCTSSDYTKIATTKGTSYTDTKATYNNPTAYLYKVVATKGSVKACDSQFRFAAYVPKGGENRYYRDKANNLHVKLYLAVNEKYAEGKALANYLSVADLYTAQVTEGPDVVTVENGVITATKAGNAVVKVTLNDEAMKIVSGLSNGGVTALSNNIVFLEVTVK